MTLKHNNPTRQRRDRDGNRYEAHAPYNFIPLPKKMVVAAHPPDQDKYTGLTGWIDCELETCSPTYIRGMMTELVFKEQGRKKPDQLTKEEKEVRAPFFSTTDKEVDGKLAPVISGSSLRGMIRQLVEILGHGRMRWVGDDAKAFIRAVAAANDDPLRAPYEQVIGRFSKNVHAGYLLQNNDKWYVMPARKWPTGETFIKIKDKQIQKLGLSKYIPFDTIGYKPQLHKVSFDAETKQGRRGRHIEITKMGERKTHRIAGNLICAGNMLESNQTGRQPSPRKNQSLILLPDGDVAPHKIDAQAIIDYKDALTPFQRDDLTDWSDAQGCLKHLNPVFYVLDENREKVIAFGHNPNFRIPAWVDIKGKKRAATPLDFVPTNLRNNGSPDLADAIFGWVEEQDKDGKIIGPEKQYAGRVFFGDAHFISAENDVWGEMITPKVLASPKPSTFQHYLTQRNPDDKKQLSHYATSPQNTQIRGYKLYWHKGSQPDIKYNPADDTKESQLTRIIPVNTGVRFTCRIHFENLGKEELGALWWALALPANKPETYRHKVGMGKPLGMGSLAITPRLHLTNRGERYDTLFANDNWQNGVYSAKATNYVTAFEQHVLKDLYPNGEISSQQFTQEPRVKMLLTMLQWHESSAAWLEKTRYMEIERDIGRNKTSNEYKERPVLPDPLHIR